MRRLPFVVPVAAAWGAWLCAHTYTRAFAADITLLDQPLGDFPFVADAALRAARGVMGATLVLLAAWQCGRWATARAVGLFEGPLEHLVVTLAIGAALLSSALTALGFVGAYRPGPVAGIVVAVSSVAAWRLLRAGRAGRGARAASAATLGVVRASLPWSAVAAAGMVSAFVAALAPETEYDALWYHLWLPKEALAAGAPVDRLEEYISLYPLGWEMLSGAALTLGGPIAGKVLHFACLPLLGAVAVLLARAVAPGAPGALVLAICVCTPTALWEGSTAYVDLALAWLTGTFVFGLVRFDTTRDRRWLLVSGVALGGALATKHLALVAAVAALPVFVVSQGRRAAGCTGSWSGALGRGAMVFLVAVLLASPWYVRAWRASGNPVFPEMYRLFGADPPDRWSAQSEAALDRFKAHFGMGRTPAALVALPWNVTTHGARFGGALGAVFLAFAPFALLVATRRGLALACGAAAYVLVWASPLGSFQLRFLLPLLPLVACAAAAGVCVVAGRARAWHRMAGTAVMATAWVLVALNLPPLAVLQERDRREWDGWLTHVLRGLPMAVVLGAESEAHYLARTVPSYRAWQAIRARTPPDARVLTFMGGDHLYSARARLSSEAPIALSATWQAGAGEEAAARLALDQLGITHLLVDRRVQASGEGRRLALLGEAMRQCCLRAIYGDERAAVYEVITTADRPSPQGPR